MNHGPVFGGGEPRLLARCRRVWLGLILLLAGGAGVGASAAGLTFQSVTNGYWAVGGANEPYAWNDADRRRPQAGDTTRVQGHFVTLRQHERIDALELQEGALEMVSSASLTLLGDSTWTRGTVAGRITNTATWTLVGSATKRLSGVCYNEGALVMGTGATLALDRGSALTNAAGSVLVLAGGAGVISSGSGSGEFPVLHIDGTLRKSDPGVAGIAFGVVLHNRGVVDLSGGELHCDMPFVQTTGTTRLASSILSSLTSISILGGELLGAGTLTGSVVNAAILRPAPTNDSLVIQGAFNQSRAGLVQVEIAGAADSPDFSRIQASGVITLGGGLEIRTPPGFVPAAGAVYPVIRGPVRVGRFTRTNEVMIGSLRLSPRYRPDGVDVVVIDE